jgi:outer membrane protein OmpA-like peptidoglycan-associated protein
MHMNRRFLLTSFTVMTSLAVAVGARWTGITPSSAAISGPREKASELEGFEPIAWLGGVHFDFNKANIRPADAKILDRDVEWLKANSNVKVAIDGGADQRGPIAYNQKLSERRARAVRDYLVARGVAPDRIVEVGYGEKLLACRGAGEACWQKNRRADFLVKTTDKQSP